MAIINPESALFKSELNRRIGYGDSTYNMRFSNLADRALKSPKTKHRGDWLFLKAYIEKTYRDDDSKALRYLNQALSATFSTPQMRDDARLMRISLQTYAENSLADIKWMLDERNAGKWQRIIPSLLEKKQLTKALLIANYDNTPDTLHYDSRGCDDYTWSNPGFRMLLSCKADDVVRYQNELAHPTMTLTVNLKPHIRQDSDYLNEIIGTLYLREGKYDSAVNYLSKVSFEYQTRMNIFRGGYLFYNPWHYYYTSTDKWYYPSYKSSFDDIYDSDDNDDSTDCGYPRVDKSRLTYLESQINAKLKFATGMSRLQKIMNSDSNENNRAMARLRYAIGRYNSLNTCWAYTQYWEGSPSLLYYDTECEYINDHGKRVDFMRITPRELTGIDNWFEKEIETAISSMTTPETLAEAHMILRNYRTIAKHYPGTPQARLIAARCDAWTDWL